MDMKSHARDKVLVTSVEGVSCWLCTGVFPLLRVREAGLGLQEIALSHGSLWKGEKKQHSLHWKDSRSGIMQAAPLMGNFTRKSLETS